MTTFDIIAPLLVPIEAPTEIKKYTKLNNANLHFVELQDLCAGLLPSVCKRIVSTVHAYLS